MKIKVFKAPEIKLPFTFSSSAEVYERMKEYNTASREIFLVIYLDAKNNVVEIVTHTIGTVDTCAVYPREIFKGALLNDSSSIILVHHHPSGEPEPSASDRQITKDIVAGAQLLQIKILDHIIIGKGLYYSFADEGLIEDMEHTLTLKNK